MSDYFEYRTIIEMQLKFEPAPFPAATVCNLNAFKASELRQYEEIAQGVCFFKNFFKKFHHKIFFLVSSMGTCNEYN